MFGDLIYNGRRRSRCSKRQRGGFRRFRHTNDYTERLRFTLRSHEIECAKRSKNRNRCGESKSGTDTFLFSCRNRCDRGRRKAKAATADILGIAAKPQRIPSRFKRYHERLVDLRDRLLTHQGDLVRDALDEQPAFSSHMADAGTDEYDRDLALGMLSSQQDSVYQIEQAIDRIREGTYGRCELTGKPIEAGRLEAIPWARFSAEAERQLEREGARKRAGLGRRETVAKVEPSPEKDDED